MFDDIVVPVDRGHPAIEAEGEKAATLAKQFDSTIHVLHVVRGLERVERDLPDAETFDGFEKLRDVFDEHGYDGDVEYEIRQGSPATEICEYSEDVDADVIIMRTHARTGMQRLAIGSITETVLRHSPCPVYAMNGDAE